MVIVTASYLMTLDTFWRMEIFWSPSFSTIADTKLLSCPSLLVTHSIQFYKILRVKLTIFGLVSFSILSNVGKTALMDASNSGLFLLTWILYSKSSMAYVLSFKEPSPVMKENSFPPWLSFYTFLYYFLIDRFIFYNLRWFEWFLWCSAYFFYYS